MISVFYHATHFIYLGRIEDGVKHFVRTTFDLLRETKPFTSPRTNILELRRILSDCNSILDVGCGRSSPLKFISADLLVGVDVYRKDLEAAKKYKTHDEYVVANAGKLREFFKPDQFDACVVLDVIEHFTKEDGLRFLHNLETIARIKVIVFTPNGFLPQSRHEEGDYQEHLSGWETGAGNIPIQLRHFFAGRTSENGHNQLSDQRNTSISNILQIAFDPIRGQIYIKEN